MINNAPIVSIAQQHVGHNRNILNKNFWTKDNLKAFASSLLYGHKGDLQIGYIDNFGAKQTYQLRKMGIMTPHDADFGTHTIEDVCSRLAIEPLYLSVLNHSDETGTESYILMKDSAGDKLYERQSIIPHNLDELYLNQA